jgi:hypothetical protein
VDCSDTRGAGTALDHLGFKHDLYVFRLPILGSVRQYFLHPMFVDEKLTRRHRSTAADSRYNHGILISIGGNESGNDGVIFVVFCLLLQTVE